MEVKVIETTENIGLGMRDGPGGPRLGCAQEVHRDLSESCSEGIDGSLGFVLFIIADTKDAVEWGDTSTGLQQDREV